MALDIFIAFLTGVVSFISPCIIPMIIVYLTTITGFTFEALLQNGSSPHIRKQVLVKTLVFVLAFTIVFTIMGSLAGIIGIYLSGFFNTMSLLAGLLFLLLGLYYIGVLKKIWSFGGMVNRDFADKWRTNDGTLSHAGVFVIGFVFALVCSHCISPTLFPTLALAAATRDLVGGGVVMLAFSLGLGMAFMVAALFFEQTMERLKWISRHKKVVHFIVGIIFLAMGILLLSGQYLSFVSLLYRLLPWKIGM